MIEKMEPYDFRPKTIIDKLNELIDAHNNHFHHARELQFGTETPEYEIAIQDNPTTQGDDPI